MPAPEDAVEDTPVVHPWHTSRLVRRHRPNGCPFVANKFVAPDSSLRFRGLNHDPTVGLNGLSIRRHLRPRSLLGDSVAKLWLRLRLDRDSVDQHCDSQGAVDDGAARARTGSIL